jgi:hypothetical protein
MIVVTPLYGVGPFTIAMRIDKLKMARAESVKSIIAIDASSRKIRSVDFKTTGSAVSFRTREGEFAYQFCFRDSSP